MSPLHLKRTSTKAGEVQDKLGVMIGLDESCSSARISRYESGVHEPPFATAKQLAVALKVPTAYLYCEEDELAEVILKYFAINDYQRAELMAKMIEI